VAEIVSDIAVAGVEQATGLGQINKALAQMDEVAQKNSALVEENAATAKMLDQQARAMDERVSLFRFDDGRPSGEVAPRTAKAKRLAVAASAA
jgi:methyl-accepting chemotaxis protein